MDYLDSILNKEYKKLSEQLYSLQEKYNSLPDGYLSKKTISGKDYYYLQKRNGDSISSKYISKDEIDYWRQIISNKKHLKTSIKELQVELQKTKKLLDDNNKYEFDYSQRILKYAKNYISKALNVSVKEIASISIMKSGMTNRSFLFFLDNEQYILRIPGEGTDYLIDRRNEYEVYRTLKGTNICEDVIFFNPTSGYKISKYIQDSRLCNPNSEHDVMKCMEKLRQLHNLKLVVNHEFDIFQQIDFYEKLRGNKSSIYSDYNKTKKNIFGLRSYIDEHITGKTLTHIDAVPDNFLFTSSGEIKLIDWEYAGMQDPHVDIAMFCIYSGYNRKQIDNLIDIYFLNNCPLELRIKVYCYISVCGLLWSNWCEYKRIVGVEFGDYASLQYQYAKDYFIIAKEEILKCTK